jgi:hypothetical protein
MNLGEFGRENREEIDYVAFMSRLRDFYERPSDRRMTGKIGRALWFKAALQSVTADAVVVSLMSRLRYSHLGRRWTSSFAKIFVDGKTRVSIYARSRKVVGRYVSIYTIYQLYRDPLCNT